MTELPHFGDCEFAELRIDEAQQAGNVKRREQAGAESRTEGTTTGSGRAGRVVRLLQRRPH